MKRTISIFALTVFLTVLAAPSFAQLPKPVEKLKGGLTKVVTSPLEVRDHTMEEYKSGGFVPFAAAGGFLKGTFYMGKKIVTGLVDIVTFPIDR